MNLLKRACVVETPSDNVGVFQTFGRLAMKLSMVLRATLFSLVCLPLFHVDAQDAKGPSQHRAVDLIIESEKHLWKPGKIDDRQKALDEILAMTDRLSSLVTSLTSWGLRDTEDEIRIKSAQALGRIGLKARRALNNLADLLEKDPNPNVRIAAANALGAVFFEGKVHGTEKRLITVLAKAMRSDDDALVQRAACSAFRMIGADANDAASDLLDVIKTTKDDYLRQLAVTSLLTVVGPSNMNLTSTLLEMHKQGLNNSDTERAVLISLGKIGAKEEMVLPLLINTLKKKDPKNLNSRVFAALALAELGPKSKSAIPALIETLEECTKLNGDDRLNLCVASLQALENIGPEATSALPAIRLIANDQHSNGLSRRHAERAISAIENRRQK